MLVLVFLLVWIIFNGQVTLEIVLFGLAIGALMYAFICIFMDHKPSTDIMVLKLLFPGIGYMAVLIWEILKANIATLKLIGTSKYELEPVIVTFDAPVKSKFGRVILANSITLTPGTITVSVEDNHYQVHCLDKELALGLDSSIFVKYIMWMEKIAAKGEKVEK